MKAENLDKAIEEAERFLKAAKEARSLAKAREYSKDQSLWISSGVHTGSVKRASMDLTRALVGVRRGH